MGRVRFLGGTTTRAWASRVVRRSTARARFRVCDRSSLAVTVTTGPRRAKMRSRAQSGRLGDATTSNRASDLVFEVKLLRVMRPK